MAEVVADQIRERITLAPGFAVTVTGRCIDPTEDSGLTTYGTSNLADHVGDDPRRVAARRAALAREVGVSVVGLVHARAEHGTTLVRVLEPSHEPRAGDGVVTNSPDVAVMAMAADCVPFAVVDPRSGAMAAVHAGWRGCARGMAHAVLEEMGHWGASSQDLQIYLGPAVCGACYEVGDDVLGALEAQATSDRWRTTTRNGGRGVDLRHYLTDSFIAGGVRPAGISRSPSCTVEDHGFYSHRRDGAHPTGRHALVVHRVTTA